MAEPTRWTTAEMITLAGRAIHKVDHRGTLGIYQVTHEEIAAMAALLALGGVPSVKPGPMQDRSPFSPIKGEPQ